MSDDGGAIQQRAGSLNLDNTQLSNNKAGEDFSTFSGFPDGRGGVGGAIYSAGELTVTNSTLNNNASGLSNSRGGSGGALYFGGTSALTIDNTTFNNNAGGDADSRGGHGGAVYFDSNGDFNLTNSRFIGNQGGNASSFGGNAGALYIDSDGGTTTLDNNLFEANSGGDGLSHCGGEPNIYFEGDEGSLIVSNNQILNNNGGEGSSPYRCTYGGALYLYGDATDIIVENNTMSGNAASSGGAIYNESYDATLTLTGNTITNNTVTSDGGAIYESSNNMQTRFSNNTISNNNAYDGAGVYIDLSGGELSLVHNTIIDNNLYQDDRTSGIGSGLYIREGDVNVLNNIVVGNEGVDAVVDAATNVLRSSGNFDSDGSLDGATTVTTASLALTALRDNGGDTMTYGLQEGSVAIDAVTCESDVTTDQRGISRPQGTSCDAGAYEQEQLMFSGTYQIENVNSGQCVDVASASTQYGANIQQWHCNQSGAQQWRFDYIDNGYYELVNLNSGLLLDVAWGGADENVQQWGDVDGISQRWKVTADENGAYTLHPQSDESECLDVNGASYNAGANIKSYACNNSDAQKFNITKLF